MSQTALSVIVAIAVASAGCTASTAPSSPTQAIVLTPAPQAPTPTQLPPAATPTIPTTPERPRAAALPTAVPTTARATSGLEAQLAWQSTQAPANGDVPGADWLEARFPSATSGATAGERRILVAVFRPAGTGPFPVIVYLHGSSGLATTMLHWAPKLSDAGFLVLAGCYTLTKPAQDRVACPDGPQADEGVAALLELAHQIPDAKPGGVGVLGLSNGAAITFRLLGRRTDIAAAVADSAYLYELDIQGAAANVRAAVLLLASPLDISISMDALQRYERELQTAGKPVEAHYYPGGEHVVTLSQPTTEDATDRTLDFFRRHLQ